MQFYCLRQAGWGKGRAGMIEALLVTILFLAFCFSLRFMINARRQDAHEDRSIALGLIADIAEGSTTANSLPRIARIARMALGDEIEPNPNDSRREKVRWRGPNQKTAHGAAPPLSPNGCGND